MCNSSRSNFIYRICTFSWCVRSLPGLRRLRLGYIDAARHTDSTQRVLTLFCSLRLFCGRTWKLVLSLFVVFSRRIFCLFCFLSHILSRPFAVGSHCIVSLSLLFCVRSCDHLRFGFLAGRSLFLHSVVQLLHRFKFNSS